jgi:hypothetical protein
MPTPEHPGPLRTYQATAEALGFPHDGRHDKETRTTSAGLLHTPMGLTWQTPWQTPHASGA